MTPLAEPDLKSGKVVPADCGCGGSAPGSLVYAIGALGFDFGTRERRDAVTAANGGVPVITNADIAHYLTSSPSPPSEFESILWTLTLDGDAVYAIKSSAKQNLGDWSMLQVITGVLAEPSTERIAVPGLITGSVTLLSGRVVPVIDPDVRGIMTWASLSMAITVGLSGAMALPPAAVSLEDEGSIDWMSWNVAASPVQKLGGGAIGPLSVVGFPGDSLVTPYSGSIVAASWSNGNPVATGGGNSGAAVSAFGGGLQFTVLADTQPRQLRVYARTYASTGEIVATLGDGSAPVYIDTSFNAFPPIAGLPGVVDGVYTITYQAPSSTLLTVQLVGTPSAATTPNPMTVALFSSAGDAAPAQSLGVGVWPASSLAAGVYHALSKVHVPEGLRLTLFQGDDFSGPSKVITATQPGGFDLPGPPDPNAFDDLTGSLVVEPENYVGIQGVTLRMGPPPGSPIVPAPVLRDFMDRVYHLLRNQGVASAERAVNYVATQATRNKVLANALGAGLSLESITAEPCSIARSGSDLWDVKLVFLSPLQVIQAARAVVRVTVDVTDVRPVMVSPPRTWTRY